MSKNNDYTTGDLLEYEYFIDYYQLIAIDLSKQTELENPNLNNNLILLENLKKIMQKCSLLLRKKKKPLLIFHKILLLNDSEDLNSKFVTRKWYVINDQNNRHMVKKMKMIQPLNLKQKSLKQIFIISQMHIFL